MVFLGSAMTGCACKSSGITVVHDSSHFDGLRTAAHELGHMWVVIPCKFDHSNWIIFPLTLRIIPLCR